jgi:uncharacterized NAD(P)/FAD-binding protein YdhS
MEAAIVGLGPWGLCALERMVTGARRHGWPGGPARVHVVEPGAAGSGVYAMTQPDYLLLNNPCGQLSMYADPMDGDAPLYGLGLYEWADRVGYRWYGDNCRIGRRGQPITPHDFLPRRVMAEYLEWFYETLVSEAPAHLEIVRHSTPALDIVQRPNGRERLALGDGSWVDVDQVVVTCGHTGNRRDAQDDLLRPMSAYPIQAYVDGMPDGGTVGLAGMGLVATDVVTALTVGRGGRFVDEGDRSRYVSSGREPTIHLFSRSGLPYAAKAVSGVDDTGKYQARICTPEVFEAIRPAGSRGTVDIRADLLPLVFAEMQVRFTVQSARLDSGADAAARVAQELTDAWSAGTFDRVLAGLAARYGAFDPAEHFFGGDVLHFESSKDYESHFYETVEADLDESLMPGGSSPVKHAYEVLRILRDPMRSVIDFGGLTPDSYVDFEDNLRSKVNRLIAGPPALRSQQLLALMDAGLVTAPFGPSPTVERRGEKTTIRSTSLVRPHEDDVDLLIQGHLEDPTINRSSSPLLAALYRNGRIKQLSYDGVEVGSVDLSEDSHPINTAGQPERRIWIFGVLTEGVRYFNHYIPSPKSRYRAFLDMQGCIDQMVG